MHELKKKKPKNPVVMDELRDFSDEYIETVFNELIFI